MSRRRNNFVFEQPGKPKQTVLFTIICLLVLGAGGVIAVLVFGNRPPAKDIGPDASVTVDSTSVGTEASTPTVPDSTPPSVPPTPPAPPAPTDATPANPAVVAATNPAPAPPPPTVTPPAPVTPPGPSIIHPANVTPPATIIHPADATAPPAPVAAEPAEAAVQDPRQLAIFKRDVLRRIDDADSTTYTDEMKEVVREAVTKLATLQRVATLYFSGGTTIADADKTVQELHARLLNPSIKEMLKGNVDAGFIILGFADPSGTPQANSKVSKARADIIRAEVKKIHPNVERIMAIGVGQTTAISERDQKNNRAVEVWLAVPE